MFKKSALLLSLLIIPVVLCAEPTYTGNKSGMVIGSKNQYLAGSTTVGAGDLVVEGVLTIPSGSTITLSNASTVISTATFMNVTGANGITVTHTVTAGTLTDGTLSSTSGAITGATTGHFSGSVTVGTLTDGTLSINSGAITSGASGHFSGAVTGGSLTDGTATLTGGNMSSVGTIGVTTLNVAGVTTFNAMPVFAMPAIDIAVTSPTIAGQMCRTATYDVYIASGPGVLTAWKKLTP